MSILSLNMQPSAHGIELMNLEGRGNAPGEPTGTKEIQGSKTSLQQLSARTFYFFSSNGQLGAQIHLDDRT